MKHILFSFSFLFLSLNFQAQLNQVTSQEKIQWFTNLEEAKQFASPKGQNILMVFAGSDWCKPCMKFKKDILENEEFSTASSDQLVILYLDFPARKKNKLPEAQAKHHEALAEKYNRSGVFPKIILWDAKAEKNKTIEYDGQSVGEFVHKLVLN